MKIKRKNFFTKELIKNFEEKHNVKYIGDFCIKNGKEWRNSPSAIFYQKKPYLNNTYSEYVALSYKYITDEDISWFISDGLDVILEPILGFVSKDGQVIYSAFKDDYETSDDKSVFITGGRENKSYPDGVEPVSIKIVNDAIMIVKKLVKYYIYDKWTYDCEFENEPYLVILYYPFTDFASVSDSRNYKEVSISKVSDKEKIVLDIELSSRKIVLSDFDIDILYKSIGAFSKNIKGAFIINKYEN